MKKTRFLGVLVISLVLFGMAFISCSHEIDLDLGVEAQDRRVGGNDEMSRHEYLTQQKMLENHKVNVDELTRIVSDAFTQTVGSYTPESSNIATTYKRVPVADNVRFRNFEQREIVKPDRSTVQAAEAEVAEITEIVEVEETEPVEVYDFAIGDEENNSAWHIMASNDTRVGHILAITEGSLEDVDNDFTQVYKEYLQDYINATIIEYNDITIDEVKKVFAATAVDAPVAGLPAGSRSTVITGPYDNNPNNWKLDSTRTDLTIQRQPLLKTKWGQGSTDHALGAYPSDFAYNNYFKYAKASDPLKDKYVTGCGATAMAQIIAYHGYLNTSTTKGKRNMPKAYNTNSSNQIPGLGVWNGATYDFALLTRYPKIYNNSPDAVKGQIAALMWHINEEIDGTIKKYETTSKTHSWASGFKAFGYTVGPISILNATSLSTTSSGFTIKYHVGLDRIRLALITSQPFLMRGENTKGEIGHVWVIDGYGSASYIEEYYSKAGQKVTKRYNLGDMLMVHCNLGWNGNDNGYNQSGWYLYGIFDTAYTWNHLSNSDLNKGTINYTSGTKIVFPVRP